jgi:feruloyl-CoA synthase
MKLVPSGDKLEIRVRGPNITPGYWKRPDLTADAFDDGRLLQAGRRGALADENDAARGVIFDGRLAEDFKLTTGTWVHVGGLRVGVLAACSPVLQDAIVAGADRAFVALLCWLNAAGCQKLIGEGAPRRCPTSRAIRGARARARSLAHGTPRIRARRSASRACCCCRRAVDRRERNHRQGLHQPAPRAGAPRHRGRAALRASPDPDVIVV